MCGGGPSLSIWHLRSLSCTGVLDTPSSSQQCAMFYDDGVCNLNNMFTVFKINVSDGTHPPTLSFCESSQDVKTQLNQSFSLMQFCLAANHLSYWTSYQKFIHIFASLLAGSLCAGRDWGWGKENLPAGYIFMLSQLGQNTKCQIVDILFQCQWEHCW